MTNYLSHKISKSAIGHKRPLRSTDDNVVTSNFGISSGSGERMLDYKSEFQCFTYNNILQANQPSGWGYCMITNQRRPHDGLDKKD